MNNNFKIILPAKIYKGWWKRHQVENDPNNLYLFGENLEFTSGNNPIKVDEHSADFVKRLYKNSKYSNRTQAVIRGLNNAIPIITKKGSKSEEFFDETQRDFDMFKRENNKIIADVIEVYNLYNNEKEESYVYIPEDGFATGKSRLPFVFADYLAKQLNFLFDFVENENIKFEAVESDYITNYDGFNCEDWYSIKLQYAK